MRSISGCGGKQRPIEHLKDTISREIITGLVPDKGEYEQYGGNVGKVQRDEKESG